MAAKTLTCLYFAPCLLLFTESVTNFIALSTSHFPLTLRLIISQHFLWNLTLASSFYMASFLTDTWVSPILTWHGPQKPCSTFLVALPPGYKWTNLWLHGCPSEVFEVSWLDDTGWGRNPCPIFLILHLVKTTRLLYLLIILCTVLQAATVDQLELTCKLKAFPSLCFNLFSVFVWHRPWLPGWPEPGPWVG